MKPGARLAAAVEVLDQILTRHRPAAQALSDWGKASRYAGSGDRSAVGNLVYDVLRRKASLAATMQSDQPRALVLGAAAQAFGVPKDAVIAMADGSQYALASPTDDERDRIGQVDSPSTELTLAQASDVPEWLIPSWQRAFGDRVVAAGQAMARRAPLDLRTNTLKATRDKVFEALSSAAPAPTPHVSTGVRIAPPDGARRMPNVEAEPTHGRGWFEVQDEGSQIAAALAGAGPRLQVLDLCAGAGGKTLAMAAKMQNTGQIYAYDRSKHQLRPIFERLARAGARNVQIVPPGDEAELLALGPRFDVVLVDAPCTGSGVWRRRPDAKWRLKPKNLDVRLAEQRAVLDLARQLTRPGGWLVYVTCSVLPEENIDQITAFRGEHPDFRVVPFSERWTATLDGTVPTSADGRTDTLLLTPDRHGTDGFFVASLQRDTVA